MSIAVVVPWAGACWHRLRAWQTVRELYQREHPAWRLEVGEPSYSSATRRVAGDRAATPFVKAAAVMPAAARCSADVVVIADADVWSPGLGAAVDEVLHGAPWAIPHRQVLRLTAAASAAAHRRELSLVDVATHHLEEPAYDGVAGGGLVVVRREVLDAVPLDPRFVGWGSEDQAWGYALETLAGAPRRGRAPLFHLWHPPQPRATRAIGNAANEQLRRRYFAARSSRPRMRALLAEIHHQEPDPWQLASS